MADGDKLHDRVLGATVTADGELMAYTLAPDHTVKLHVSVSAQRYDSSENDEIYSYSCIHVFNKAGAALAVLRASAVPVELDPQTTGWSVAAAANGNDAQVSVTGAVGESVRWTGETEGLDIEQVVSAGSVTAYAPLSQSLSFDAVDEKVDFGNAAATDYGLGETKTTAIWMKSSPQTNLVEYMFTRWNEVAYCGMRFFLYNELPYYEVISNVGTGDYVSRGGDAAVTDGAWHLLVATQDGTDTVAGTKLYVDGVLQTTAGTGNGRTSFPASGTELYVGSGFNGGDVYAYGGLACHSCILDVELSAAEVAEMYSLGVPINLTDIVAAGDILHWCTLGDGCAIGAGNCPDLSPLANDGTTVNIEVGDFVADVPP